jgi:hypothetical protein
MTTRSLATLICVAAPAFCDVKISTSYTTDGQTAETAIYGNGARLRYDYGNGVVLLRQCDQKAMVELNDKDKSYLSLPIEPGDAKSGNTEVIDTGERKDMFGISARHLKLIAKDPRTETDGWYAEIPALGVCSGLDGEAAKRGYPLQYTRIQYGENGKPASAMTMKVTAIEASPLQAALFDVPSGYADSSKPKAAKDPSVIRVGAVRLRSKSGQGAGAFDHMMAQLTEAKIDVLPLADAAPDAIGQKAREMNCDYVLYSEVAAVDKAATGKLGGMLHKTPGLGKVTGGEPFEAHVNYSLAPVAGGNPISGSATGKTASSFNWKSAALLASNFVPMAMAARMFSGALNPAMLNAAMAGGQGSARARMDPMMGGISMFLQATGVAGQGTNSAHTNADTAIAAALEQEGRAVIAQVKK